MLDFYEFLCIINVYSIGIPKSEILSDIYILDKGYRSVFYVIISLTENSLTECVNISEIIQQVK